MTNVKFYSAESNGTIKNPMLKVIRTNLINKQGEKHSDFAEFLPPVNISEDNENYCIELSVPGYNKKELKIMLDNFTLEVSSEKSGEDKPGKFYSCKEFNHRPFKRRFNFPETADFKQIGAKCEHGILTINISKQSKEKPAKIIEIK